MNLPRRRTVFFHKADSSAGPSCYRAAVSDSPAEGYLGGGACGLGRGAAPPKFGRGKQR